MGRIPTPVLWLAAGIAAGGFSHDARTALSFDTLGTLGSVLLIFILFSGGLDCGWKRTREALRPILVLGVAGTLLTAALVAVVCHFVFGLPLQLSVLVAIALAPTDPAAVFAVLGGGEDTGRPRTILEGEAGFNDPAGIAMMYGALGVIAASGSAALAVLDALAHGAFYVGVYLLGLALAERSIVGHKLTSLASISAKVAEAVMFVALGLTAARTPIGDHLALGLGIFAVLAFVIRPAVIFMLQADEEAGRSEQLFIAWGGLKGVVPILLATLPTIERVRDADRIYAIVFVAVVASVVLQGSTVRAFARRLGLTAS